MWHFISDAQQVAGPLPQGWGWGWRVTFLMILMVILMNVVLDTVWQNEATFRRSGWLSETELLKYCSRMLQRSIQTARGQRISIFVSCCNWSLRNYCLLSFDVVSKQNIHNYLKILKYSSFFQFQIFTKLDFLDVPQPNMLQNKQCRIYENLAVFY